MLRVILVYLLNLIKINLYNIFKSQIKENQLLDYNKINYINNKTMKKQNKEAIDKTILLQINIIKLSILNEYINNPNIYFNYYSGNYLEIDKMIEDFK